MGTSGSFAFSAARAAQQVKSRRHAHRRTEAMFGSPRARGAACVDEPAKPAAHYYAHILKFLA
jgi:hypothetical protein